MNFGSTSVSPQNHASYPPAAARAPRRCGAFSGPFLHACAARFGRGEKILHPETITWFDNYSWPGNIRELENLIYREYLLADGLTINIAPLAPTAVERRLGLTGAAPTSCCLNFSEAKNHAIAKFEQYYLAEALTKAQGNVTKAANLVGKDRRAFGKLAEETPNGERVFTACRCVPLFKYPSTSGRVP